MRVTRDFLGSNKAFWLIAVGFFAVSTYLALTKDFPGVFDEMYHFALISHYSDQLSPFITVQPAELAITGDATRLASYLSHYFMSIPLRLVEIFSSNVFSQVIVLRMINVAVVIASLVVFRKFLVKLVKSPALSNTAVALYCVFPVTSQLASTINYDNWVLLCFASTCWLVQRVIHSLITENSISLKIAALLAVVLITGSLVKFTFLPIAATIVALVVSFIGIRQLLRRDIAVTVGTTKIRFFAIACVLLIMSGLAIERYGYNITQYGKPQPDCASVQPLDVCLQYGPWARNHALQETASQASSFDGRSIGSYVVNLWLPISMQGISYFGDNDSMVTLSRYIHAAVSTLLFAIIIGVVVATIKNIKNYMYIVTVVVSCAFVVTLVGYNYIEYIKFQQPIAIQGRYVLPLLMPIMAVGLVGVYLYVQYCMRLVVAISYLWRQVSDMEMRQAFAFSRDFWAVKIQNIR